MWAGTRQQAYIVGQEQGARDSACKGMRGQHM